MENFSKMQGNIFVDYPDVVAECQNRGLVPALFLDKVSDSVLRGIRHISPAGRYTATDAVFVPCDQKAPSADHIVNFCSGFLCAHSEEEALRAFRLRGSLEAFLKSTSTKKYCLDGVYGIDAQGYLHNSRDIPLFCLHDVDPHKLHSVIEQVNDALCSYHTVGSVYGRMLQDDTAYVGFSTYAGFVPSHSQKQLRRTARNSVWRELSDAYKVELLDDRGGRNYQNILSYLTPANQKYYIQERRAQQREANALASRAGIEHAGMECCDLGAKSQPDAAAEHDVSMQR